MGDGAGNRLIGWAIAISIAWLLFLIVLVLVWSSPSISAEFHPSKMGLNEIGDFLAGAASPLALLWLVVTVWLQKVDLNNAHRQFLAAESNSFRLGLFEKRYEVKEQLQRSLAALPQNGTITVEARRDILNAIEMARYLFDDDVKGALDEVWKKMTEWRRHNMRAEDLQKRNNLTEEETKKLDGLLQKLLEIDEWMFEQLQGDWIQTRFAPYLKMPPQAPR